MVLTCGWADQKPVGCRSAVTVDCLTIGVICVRVCLFECESDSSGSSQTRFLKLNCYSGKKKKGIGQSQWHFTSISQRSLSVCPIVRLPNHVRTIKARHDKVRPLVRWLRLRSEFGGGGRICESASDHLPSHRPAEICPQLAALQFPLFRV